MTIGSCNVGTGRKAYNGGGGVGEKHVPRGVGEERVI